MLKENRQVRIISYKQILCQVEAFNGNLVTDKINYRNSQWIHKYFLCALEIWDPSFNILR